MDRDSLTTALAWYALGVLVYGCWRAVRRAGALLKKWLR